MIKNVFFPGCAGVAGFAFRSVVACVPIIFQMATYAAHLHYVIEWILTVAVIAAQLCVLSVKREVGIASMVETGICPRTRVMAGITLVTTASLVHIVFSVTAVAGCWRVLVCLVGMAGQTLDFAVIADESKASHIMIEGRVCPVPGIVAIGTFAAQIAFVCIIFLMAINAFPRRVAVFNIGHVTGRTLSFSMMTKQFKVSEKMIESSFVQPQNISVSAFVVGMAGRARATVDIR